MVKSSDTQSSAAASRRRGSARATILIVDDETYVRDSLASLLRRREFAVRAASSPAEALAGRGASSLEGVDAVVTDLKMPGEDGLSLLRQLAEQHPVLPVIVLTGHGTVLSAVECMKAGAQDYLLKPANPEELVLVLDRVLKHSDQQRELEYLRSGDRGLPQKLEPLGVSDGWKHVLRMVEVAAPTDTTVLLLGESGTGKEEVAKLVHARSARARNAFVCVNCAAIPRELFESEFFGHRRGSFTGAIADREGRFRVAHRGTLFMDEINSLPETAQAKVLRVIQDGVFERVGDSQPTNVDVRLVCASNADLQSEVDAGRFRADLFYRINVMTIQIPPLRARRDDIPVLAEAFLREFTARLHKSVHTIAAETMNVLLGYHWPGNVRELRNVIERGVLVETEEELAVGSLPFSLLQIRTGAPPDTLNLRTRLADVEKRVLIEALEQSRGVRREAARMLGVDERNLAYYLRKHDLMSRGRS